MRHVLFTDGDSVLEGVRKMVSINTILVERELVTPAAELLSNLGTVVSEYLYQLEKLRTDLEAKARKEANYDKNQTRAHVCKGKRGVSAGDAAPGV